MSVGTTYLRFDDLQVPNLYPTRSEIRNLKLDTDRPLSLSATYTAHASSKTAHHTASLLIVTSDRRQSKFRTHEELFAAAELLNLPNNGGSFGSVVHGADIGAEARSVSVLGDGDTDLDVVGCAPSLKLCFSLQS
jgi:hypothetical protein